MRRSAIVLIALLAGCGPRASTEPTNHIIDQLIEGTARPADCRDQTADSAVVRKALALCAIGQTDHARRLVMSITEEDG